MLTTFEWEKLIDITLLIHREDDFNKMRLLFLQNLRSLISFDASEFSLVDEEKRVRDMIEFNTINGEPLDIEKKYNEYKENFDANYTDYIFDYPFSYIACNYTTRMREKTFTSSNFNMVYLKSIGMKHACTVTISPFGTCLGEFSLYYSTDPDFSEKDVYILSLLVQHLNIKFAKLFAKQSSKQNYLLEAEYSFLRKYNLTNRELEIITCFVKGLSYDDISKTLFISINTLKKHIYNIYKKLGVNSQVQLKYFLDNALKQESDTVKSL